MMIGVVFSSDMIEIEIGQDIQKKTSDLYNTSHDILLHILKEDMSYAMHPPSHIACACVARARILQRITPVWCSELELLTKVKWYEIESVYKSIKSSYVVNHGRTDQICTVRRDVQILPLHTSNIINLYNEKTQGDRRTGQEELLGKRMTMADIRNRLMVTNPTKELKIGNMNNGSKMIGDVSTNRINKDGRSRVGLNNNKMENKVLVMPNIVLHR